MTRLEKAAAEYRKAVCVYLNATLVAQRLEHQKSDLVEEIQTTSSHIEALLGDVCRASRALEAAAIEEPIS